MHRLGDKEPEEYRAQVEKSVDDLGSFLEDEETERAANAEIEKVVEQQMEQFDDEWYRNYLSRMWEGKLPDG